MDLERATCLSPFCFLALQLSTLKTTLLLNCNYWILKNYNKLSPDKGGMFCFYSNLHLLPEFREKFSNTFRENRTIKMVNIFENPLDLFCLPFMCFFKLIMGAWESTQHLWKTYFLFMCFIIHLKVIKTRQVQPFLRGICVPWESAGISVNAVQRTLREDDCSEGIPW